MRVLLLTGKGGVGKTTLAAAAAVHAARCGIKTLVLSTDAAHSLGDALGHPLPGDRPHELDGGLWAQQVDASARLRQVWGGAQAYLLQLLHALDVEPLDAAELTMLPGADDLLTLLALQEQAADGPWDLVVVDCAPTAETLRLLALPEALTRLVDRLLPAPRLLTRTLAPTLGRRSGVRAGLGAGLGAGLPAPDRELGPALLRLRTQLARALEVVRAPTTSVRLVLTPEAVVLAEAQRTWTALALHGLVVDGVVANRTIPASTDGASTDGWQAGWVRAQQAVLGEAVRSFAPLPVTTAPYLPSEPVGLRALGDLGAAVWGPQQWGSGTPSCVLTPPPPAERLRVERRGEDFELVLDLPLARADQVDLARRDDDLVVGVGGQRRVVALPPVLRRCVVVDAVVRSGALRVRFTPDPDQWPTGAASPAGQGAAR